MRLSETEKTSPRRRYPELSLISLARAIDTEDGRLPAGATGTVVHVYPGALAYEIEFHHPVHTVATVAAGAISG